jgi:hypothetical protein
LLNDLFYGGSGFEVLEHGGHCKVAHCSPRA